MAPKRKPVYLVDASSYVYRAFFALPPLSSPTGMPTNAVYGFTTMLLKLLADVTPEYLAVVFDAPGRTFRDDLYDRYKANRPETPPDLSAQIDSVHEVADAMGVRRIVMEGVEADDVIATLVDAVREQGAECVIVTGDKDLMQLVGPGVRLWDTMRDRWTDAAAVRARLGVAPEQVADVMALMGDSVDNIPGVKGIGEKTAVALVQAHGGLEEILAGVDAVAASSLRGARKIAERLREQAAEARLSRSLVELRHDVAVDRDLESLRRGEPQAERLRALFSRLGFQSLLPQVMAAAPAQRLQAEHITEPTEIERRVGALVQQGALALTVGDDGEGEAAQVVLATSDVAPIAVPLDDAAAVAALRTPLAATATEVIAHDFKRELRALRARGVDLGGSARDVMIAGYVLGGAAQRLEDLAADLLGAHLPAFRDGTGGLASGVDVLPDLWAHFRERLADAEAGPLFYEIEMPLARILADMEERGIGVDVQHLQTMSAEVAQRMDALMEEIHALAEGPFNIGSPPQLREVLFERLGLPTRGVRRGKTGLSTDVDVLNRLAEVHPLPSRILEYRQQAKLKNTYLDALPLAVRERTGRLHTTFHQTVAATGRLSSSEPNLQNIPIRGEDGRRIRAAFVAPPGHLLLAADYSQIELRILAHLSGDPALVEAFTRDQDIHARTAAEVFGALPGTVSGDMRRTAKVINFGIIYGMGPQRLAQELGIPVPKAQKYIRSYFERYGRVRAFMDDVVREARETGYVRTLMGRRRSLPELRSPRRSVAQAAERAATNTPIQGSAADVIKAAMVRVAQRIQRDSLPACMVLQVHDELLFEVREDACPAVAEVVREEMERVVPLRVPLRVDIGWGRNWAEAH